MKIYKFKRTIIKVKAKVFSKYIGNQDIVEIKEHEDGRTFPFEFSDHFSKTLENAKKYIIKNDALFTYKLEEIKE